MSDVVVEIGPGTAPFLPQLSEEFVNPGSRVLYVDRDRRVVGLLAQEQSAAGVVLGSADHLGLPSESVDMVMLPNVWGVLSGGIKGSLPEIMRVVKPGGRVVVLETAGPVRREDVEAEMQAQGAEIEKNIRGERKWWVFFGIKR